MSALLRRLDEVPVSMLVALAYVTLAFLTHPLRPTAEQLAAFGWLTPLAAAGGEPWRLLTYAVLHGGLVHLAFNTYMLLAIGPALERALGSFRFLILYVTAALGGGLGVCLLYAVDQPVVGGSGALFGMLGGMVAIHMQGGRHLLSFLDYEGPRRLLWLIGLNLVLGLLIPFVSNTAHVGGLLAGFAVTFLWFLPGGHLAPGTVAQWRAASAALLLSVGAYSLWPVARYDWLWNRSVNAASPERRQELQRAAAMSWFGTATATAADVERFYSEVVVGNARDRRRR